MNVSLRNWILFAQVSKWLRLGDGLHGSRGRTDFTNCIPYGMALAVLGIAIAVFVVLKKRNDFPKPCHDPQELFRELSQAHKLDRGGQRLLRELADAFQLDQPAEIFLQPALSEVRQIPQHLQAKQERLAELCQRLF